MAESIKKGTTNRLYIDTQYMQGVIVGEGALLMGQKTYNVKIIYGTDIDIRQSNGPKELFTNVKMAACDPTKGDLLEIGDTVIIAFLGKDYNNPVIITASGKTVSSSDFIEASGDKIENQEDPNTDFTSGEQLKNMTFIHPNPGATVTSGFGTRIHPITNKKTTHKGLDLAKGYGTPLLASAGGKIKYCLEGPTKGWGYYVEIDHGNGLLTRYAHCGPKKDGAPGVPPKREDWNLFKDGSQVKQGDIIAYEGSTGGSTGAHVHFEIRVDGTAVDPKPIIGA